MLAVGVDVVEIDRIAQMVERFGERFLQRIYTPAEQAYCAGRAADLAARFAAKEAISKAMGTGMSGLRWTDLEVVVDERGHPSVCLHGPAQARAKALGWQQCVISLSHSRGLAIAVVVAQG